MCEVLVSASPQFYTIIVNIPTIQLNLFSNANVRRASSNFCNFSGYLSPPTRLPAIARSQKLARAIINLYYSYNTTYIIDLNSIIYWSSPGFEPGSPEPKVATLPLCYGP